MSTSTSKDLLTEILDTVTAVHAFISGDLARENLSPDCKTKRDRFSQILSALCSKIRAAPLSMRPRMNTPSEGKPPPPTPTEIPEMTEEEEGEQDTYTDMDTLEGAGVEEPTDYLEFEPSQTSGDLSQETYEAMVTDGQDDDVYEEPQPGPQENAELYSEPTSSQSDGRPSTSSSLHPITPSQSRENSASGSEFIESTRERAQLDRAAVLADISTDWTGIYSPPKKGSGDSKVGSLKSVSIKGILEKLGGHSKKAWQKRYCVMSGPLMYFYEKESSKSYNNFICVLNFTVALEPTMTNEKKKQFAFKLTHTDTSTGKKKDYCFRAISADTRAKWMAAVEKVIKPTNPPHLKSGSSLTVPGIVGASATLPRMPSGGSIAPPPVTRGKPRARTMSTGEGDEELYEDMPEPIKEESEDDEDYLPVSPVHEIEELTSSAEYVAVQPGADDMEEEYEDTTAYQADMLPAPPITPPPGPPTSHPQLPTVRPPIPTVTPPLESLPPAKKAPAPAPPNEPEIDTEKVYTQGSNGIVLNKVYVILWDFEAHDKDELRLSRGDLVLVSDPRDGSDWWFGELLDNNATKKLGREGLFPRQYSDIAFESLET